MFGKLLTNQKIAHKIVKPYVYKALREGLKLMTTVKYKISEGSAKMYQNAQNQRFGHFFCPNRCAKMLQNAPFLGCLAGCFFEM